MKSLFQSAILGLGLLTLSTLALSSCKKREGAGHSSAGENYKGPAVKGDWQIVWLPANPEGLNPAVGNDGYSSIVTSSIFDTLIFFDVESGEPKPRAASSWTISQDGLLYEFKLRPGMKFHDGHAVTSEDVKFTLDAIMDIKTDSASMRNYLADIKDVTAPDPMTVRFTMKRPYFRNLIVLGLIEIIPKHIYGVGDINKNPLNRAPIGSGPYKFSKWSTGQSIELLRFEDYWGNSDPYYQGRNNFDKILFKVITDQNVAAMALKKGDIDSVDPTPTMFLKDLTGADFEKNFYRLKYSTDDGNGYRYICWNFKKPLFQSKEVRQALSLLLPRDEINQKMFENLLTPAVGPFPVGSDKTDPNLKAIPYDQAKALALLAQAGFKEKDKDGYLTKNGQRFSFELLFGSGSAEVERTALIFQQALKEAGIEMKLRTLEWTVFLKQRQERKFDALMMSWTSSLDGDPYQIWHSSQEKDGGSNGGAYANKRVDEILVTARATLDRKKRNALYQEMSRIIYDEQPYLFLFERPHLLVATKRFANVLPTGKIGIDSTRWFTPPGAEKYKVQAKMAQ